jgi:choline dehydrogenase-like flavoprotein
MREAMTNYRGIPGTVYSDEYARSHGFYLECLFGHPVYGSLVMPSFGVEHFDLMKKFDRIAGFGIMLVDSVDARNRVELTSSGPRIHYQLSASDRERYRFAAERAVHLMFAAGADEVLLASDEPVGGLPMARFRTATDARFARQLNFIPHRTTLTSAHCQSTVKMSGEPRNGIVNARCESHHVRNLIVCDSSSFPASCGVNPMMSIMTLARYQGLRIAAEFDRYAA